MMMEKGKGNEWGGEGKEGLNGADRERERERVSE